MKILLVGSGGREHAILQKLAESPEHPQIFVAPGNAGMEELATRVPIGVMDFDALTEFARRAGMDFCVVSPDDPLVGGLVDRMEDLGIPCFGPSRRAARIEGSKAFAKALMRDNDIPTAAYAVFDRLEEARQYLRDYQDFPIVVKADGLALGKGVLICQDRPQAERALHSLMAEGRFGESGRTVVLEEFLEGPEITLLCFCDGERVVPMLSSMDHKRALDGDRGPNTGGMGVIAPSPFYTPALAEVVRERILEPTVRALREDGRTFRGCLYVGLILTSTGPKVIEYNCRFGDPEAECLLPMLRGDLLRIFRDTASGSLRADSVDFNVGASFTLMLCSGGYPGDYEKGKEIRLEPALEELLSQGKLRLYHCATTRRDGRLFTAGGRVLALTAMARELAEARDLAYRAASLIHFEGMFMRRDIGAVALAAGTTAAGQEQGRTEI